MNTPGLEADNGSSEAANEEVDGLDTVHLFDGSSLDHFRGYNQEAIGEGWKIEGDTLHFSGSGGDICTREEFGDCEIEFDWKVAEGSNSGVIYRVSLGDSAPYVTGPEYQILDDDKHPDGQNPATSAAALYGLYPATDKLLNKAGEWNSAKIVLRGPKIEHWLNGKQVVSADVSSDQWKEKIADSKFATWEKFATNEIGHICFQDHGDPVWYRNIRVRVLNSD